MACWASVIVLVFIVAGMFGRSDVIRAIVKTEAIFRAPVKVVLMGFCVQSDRPYDASMTLLLLRYTQYSAFLVRGKGTGFGTGIYWNLLSQPYGLQWC